MKNKKGQAVATKEVVTEGNEITVENAIGNTPLADQIAAGSVVIAPTAEPKKQLGRPVDPNSARAKRVAEMEAKRIANGGILPLGRPAVVGSARQLKLAEAAAKKADPNHVVKRGRPKMTEDEKIAWKAKREEAAKAFAASHAGTGALMSTAELINQEQAVAETAAE